MIGKKKINELFVEKTKIDHYDLEEISQMKDDDGKNGKDGKGKGDKGEGDGDKVTKSKSKKK